LLRKIPCSVRRAGTGEREDLVKLVRTYGELFEKTLQERLKQGGLIAEVCQWADAYRKEDPWARERLFKSWLAEASVECEWCGQAFKAQNVTEDDLVLCKRCR
jgi:hypothetical protein